MRGAPSVPPCADRLDRARDERGVGEGARRVVDQDDLRRPLARDRLETQAAVLQSHWWDGALVTTYGLRRDQVKRYSVGSASFATRTDFTRVYNPGAMDGLAPANTGERDTLTYSGVLRLNRLIGRRLPRGVEIDLHYGWSENYQGLTGVRSIKGGFFDAPIGETTEQGISIGLFDGAERQAAAAALGLLWRRACRLPACPGPDFFLSPAKQPRPGRVRGGHAGC